MTFGHHPLIPTGLTTVFYLSYLVSEAPGNYLMQKFNIGRFLGICMFFWGKLIAQVRFRQC
jgi:ACS family allantoate permease-like MFS transporter